MAAVFVIVVLAAFGLLVARFIGAGAVSSAEDYVWAQALYAADSAARLSILKQDGGGNWPGGFTSPTIGMCTTTEVSPPTSYNAATRTGTVEVRATGAQGVARTVIVKYRL